MRRSTNYSDKELEDIGKDLIAWSQIEGNWHVSGFELDRNLPLKFCRNMGQRRKEVFRDLYMRAKEVLGHKIIKKAMDSGADRWVVATLVPKYLSDIEDYIDGKKQKELIMIEKAKGLNEQATSEKADSIINAADKIAEEHDDSSKFEAEREL